MRYRSTRKNLLSFGGFRSVTFILKRKTSVVERASDAITEAKMLLLRRQCSGIASSFLARAAATKDPTVLLGKFSSAGRFDQVFADNLDTTKIGPEGVTCTLDVTPSLCNNYGYARRTDDMRMQKK